MLTLRRPNETATRDVTLIRSAKSWARSPVVRQVCLCLFSSLSVCQPHTHTRLRDAPPAVQLQPPPKPPHFAQSPPRQPEFEESFFGVSLEAPSLGPRGGGGGGGGTSERQVPPAQVGASAGHASISPIRCSVEPSAVWSSQEADLASRYAQPGRPHVVTRQSLVRITPPITPPAAWAAPGSQQALLHTDENRYKMASSGSLAQGWKDGGSEHEQVRRAGVQAASGAGSAFSLVNPSSPSQATSTPNAPLPSIQAPGSLHQSFAEALGELCASLEQGGTAVALAPENPSPLGQSSIALAFTPPATQVASNLQDAIAQIEAS